MVTKHIAANLLRVFHAEQHALGRQGGPQTQVVRDITVVGEGDRLDGVVDAPGDVVTVGDA